jgi:hypothetical protein
LENAFGQAAISLHSHRVIFIFDNWLIQALGDALVGRYSKPKKGY